MSTYPGTPRHQAVLAAIVAHYADDPRLRALCVFGSLGRGSWDQYSDLDLDVVLTDGVAVDIEPEVQQLCASLLALGETVAFIEPDGPEAADIVFDGLLELSIRYHPLNTTSAEVVDSLKLLHGPLDVEGIKNAGLANRRIVQAPNITSVDQYVRLAVGVDIALQRKHYWRAVQLLQLMRGVLLDVFARSHGGSRPFYVFAEQASPALQARMAATLPQASLRSTQQALRHVLEICEQDLGEMTNGQLVLTAAHRRIIAQVRNRQATLQLPDNLS